MTKHEARGVIRISFVGRLIALCLLISCTEKKSDPAEAANTFFSLIREGRTQEAYDSAAFGFQAAQSMANFEGTVRELNLAKFAGLEWKQSAINKKDASLDGEITTQQGQKVPVAVTFVKDGGLWKLYSLHTPAPDDARPTVNRFSLVGKGAGFQDAFDKKIPPSSEIVALVRESLLKFEEGIQQKDFAVFYDYLSEAWKAQLSQKRLQRAFQPFIDASVSVGGVAQVEPVFDRPPAITSEGLLVMSGYFPTKPYRTVFSVKYIYELPKWKLFGLDVNLVE